MNDFSLFLNKVFLITSWVLATVALLLIILHELA